MADRRVVAVVAVFRPDDGFAERLARTAEQVDAVVVVDDGSGAAPPESAGAEFISHGRNRGIAAALNTGIARARELDATHVLTLDQDTTLEDGYVATALGTLEAARETRLGVAVADVINGTPSVPTWWSPEGIALAPEAIQSGMVVPLAVLDAVGGFDDDLFIDSVDREFCHRLRASGWAVAIARGAEIRHAIGERMPLRGGGEYEWHPPFRQYYMVRNGIVVARRFRRSDPEQSNLLLRSTWDESVKLIRNGPRRWKHALATGLGGVQGLFGSVGRIPRLVERLLR